MTVATKAVATLLFTLLFPLTMQAQVFPDAYIVTGVASDDVLNIRAEPDASSDIVGELGPYTINIEVLGVSEDARWGQISTGEGNGWVAMRYLEASNHTAAGEFPRPMSCFGTEPFWALNMLPRGDAYQMMGEENRDLTPVTEVVAYQGYAAVFEEGPALTRTLMITRGWCSDWMSDREYGWQATLLNQTPEGNSLQYGCCTLDYR